MAGQMDPDASAFVGEPDPVGAEAAPQAASFRDRGAKPGRLLGDQAYEDLGTQRQEKFRLQAAAAGRDRRNHHIAGESGEGDPLKQLPLCFRVQATDIEDADAAQLGAEDEGKIV